MSLKVQKSEDMSSDMYHVVHISDYNTRVKSNRELAQTNTWRGIPEHWLPGVSTAQLVTDEISAGNKLINTPLTDTLSHGNKWYQCIANKPCLAV